jgi:DNA-binding transcriptional ArsR family regulator
MLLPRTEGDGPDARTLIDVLGASHSQTILETVSEPMTVKQISHVADVPLSSAYRRVRALSDAGLLDERIAIDPEEGKHVTQYSRAFDRLELRVTDGGVAVEIIE